MKIFRYIVAGLFVLAGIVSGAYLAIWWGIVEPVLSIAKMIDTHTLTASGVAVEVIKFVFRDVLAVIAGASLIFCGIAIGHFNKRR